MVSKCTAPLRRPAPGNPPYLNGIHDDFKATDGEHLGFPQRMVIQVAVGRKYGTAMKCKGMLGRREKVLGEGHLLGPQLS